MRGPRLPERYAFGLPPAPLGLGIGRGFVVGGCGRWPVPGVLAGEPGVPACAARSTALVEGCGSVCSVVGGIVTSPTLGFRFTLLPFVVRASSPR